MKTTNTRFTVVAMGVLAMLYVTGCEKSNQAPTEGTLHQYDINAYPLDKVVCDPFAGGGGTSAQQGIKAELFYRGLNQPAYNKAQDYVDHATKAEQNLFFTEMFVPTRMFDVGFTTQTSGVLKNDSGQTLIEYFGLKMDTSIRLSANDAEGIYEFALLSDDGSMMKIKENGNWSTVIDNDGDHPTRMGCSTRTIAMTKETRLETEVLYYQGPRYHIANVLMWRKLAAGQTAGTDSACGVTGNGTWFDPHHSSQPTANFSALFNRGWNVVSQGNFYIPTESTETTQYNPCTVGTAPVISNLQIAELVSTDIWVIWNTDIPSTAQLMITNMETGDSVLTQTDNVLRTNHYIHHSGLTANTHYQVKAVNISGDLGKAISNPIDFTTP